MKKIALCLLCLLVVAGCAAYKQTEEKAGAYRAKILIGQKRAVVLAAAEKVFGKPKQVSALFPNSDFEVKLRRYKFTNVSDFVMYFHKGVFIQAALMPVASTEYPALRSDYRAISAGKPGPVLGYTIFMNDKEVVLDTIRP